MKKLLLLLLMCGAMAWAQPACVQVIDTLYSVGVPNLTPMTGYIDLNQGYIGANGAFVVTQSAGRLTVTNGVVNTCQSPGQLQALYSVQNAGPVASFTKFTTIWTIPGGGGPYTVQQVLGTRAISLAWASRGLLQYSQPVTAQTLVTVPNTVHRLGANVVVICEGIAECGSVQVTADGTVTVTSIVPWTGILYVLSSPLNSSLSFTSALSVQATWLQTGITTIIASACYDSNGYQFGAGGMTLTPYPMGISGVSDNGSNMAITLSSLVVQTGRCVVLGE